MRANLKRAPHGYNRGVAKPDKKETPRLIAENRKARYDYFIEERLEAGLVLEGWEVKSMRAGKAQIAEGYVYLKDGEAFLFGALVTPLNTTSTPSETIAMPGACFAIAGRSCTAC